MESSLPPSLSPNLKVRCSIQQYVTDPGIIVPQGYVVMRVNLLTVVPIRCFVMSA